MFIHNYIKILYMTMGYLSSYPYYLVSDNEMFDAFLKQDGFFADFYPCPDDSLQDAYDALLAAITSHIEAYKSDGTTIPDWVYSYMLMRPVTFQSDEADISYICDMGGITSNGLLAEFTPEVAKLCYDVSVRWLQKQPNKYGDRPPTMFGETHVTKSLRLLEANILDS